MENHNSGNNTVLSSLPKQKWWGDSHLFKVDDGFWFSAQRFKLIDRVVKNFKPLPNDVILASFPKTGTTWLKSLIYAITNRSTNHVLTQEHPHELVPILEAQVYATSNEPFLSSTDPSCNNRLFSTHIPYQLLSKALDSSQCKVVYVTRNPKDTLVSFWHFVNKWDAAKQNPWTREEAVDKFCLGVVPGGPYYEHVLGYRDFSSRSPERVFFVTYEELIEDPGSCVERLAEFLGFPFEGGEDEKREQVEEVVKMCSFDVLSNYGKNKSEEYPVWYPRLAYNSFFRKGGVGDHKNYLTEDDIERIDLLTREKFHSRGFMYGL